MSESYLAVLFPTLSRAEAAPAETRVTAALQDARVIGADTAPDSVYRAEDYAAVYAPAPAFASLRTDDGPWDTFASPSVRGAGGGRNGVGVRVGFGINGLEFNMLSDMTCPVCMAETVGEDASDMAGHAAAEFFASGIIPAIECPSCREETDAREWVSSNVPGFAYLAYEFWNWPDLRLPGWSIDIPALMASAAGGPVRFGGAML